MILHIDFYKFYQKKYKAILNVEIDDIYYVFLVKFLRKSFFW